jgi:hypothetical protein
MPLTRQHVGELLQNVAQVLSTLDLQGRLALVSQALEHGLDGLPRNS